MPGVTSAANSYNSGMLKHTRLRIVPALGIAALVLALPSFQSAAGADQSAAGAEPQRAVGEEPQQSRGKRVSAPESLQAALRLSIEQGVTPVTGGESDLQEDASNWLASPPTLGVSYLNSDERLGTDETELSINFPFKAPTQRRSDAALRRADPALGEANDRFRRWYLSGSLRDLFNRHQQSLFEASATQAASALLEKFEQQLREQVVAGASDRYALLAAQRRRSDVDAQLQRYRAQASGALQLYQRMTGASAFPEVSGDTQPLPPAPLYAQHPALTLLDVNYERDRAAVRSSAPSATPWNIALVARQLDIPNFSERQVGVAMEIPLTLGAKPAPATTSSLNALQHSYLLLRDQRLVELRQQWQSLNAERSALLARQARIPATLDAKTLQELLQATQESRELPIEVRLERMLTLLDAQQEPRRITLALESNAATLRQIAGMIL